MKSSLSKLKKIALQNHKGGAKDKRSVPSLANFDELTQAAKDMQEMRHCYDSLLSAAAATVNSAYEFSESLREIGDCFLEYTPLHDDDESSRVLVMLGNVQLELQKLVDSYRSNVLTTITKPSESLLNELQTVEEMKRQCDKKRDVYQYLIAQHQEKGKSKTAKGECVTSHELLAAYDEYKEEANLCVFRLKSLKQGQLRSLLTQAARHHTAQFNFFQRGLKSLETIDPHVRHVSTQQHIDCLVSGTEEYASDGYEDENNYYANDAGELSFSYKSNKEEDVSTSHHPLEKKFDKYHGESKVFIREPKMSSHSAPLIAEKKFDIAENAKQLKMQSAKKSHTYILPTPNDAKGTGLARPSVSASKKKTSLDLRNLWHSSPLEDKKDEKDSVNNRLQDSNSLKAWSVVRECNSNATSMELPLPSADGLPLPRIDTSSASDMKITKRKAFSDPLTSSKPWSGRKVPSTSGPIESTVPEQEISGAFSLVSLCQRSSPKVSPSSSPLVSSPKISELHELPRPPRDSHSTIKSVKISSHVGHSAPLVSRNQEFSVANKSCSLAPSTASPLPTPPFTVPRSFSIPSSSQRAMAMHVAKLLDATKPPDKVEVFASPPLTPISVTNMKPLSRISGLSSDSGEIQGKFTTISSLYACP